MQHHVEVAVIGAGVVGLAIARALSMKGKEVLVLERASAIGTETSSRNSEVIHAGLYYDKRSFKARFCVRGKQLLYDYCDARQIPYNRCGKLIVATHQDQWLQNIPLLRDNALRCGVQEVRLLDRHDAKALEPQLECVGALWSTSTGVIDSHSFMLSLLADAEENGAILALNTPLENGAITQDGIVLSFDGAELLCKTVVNCSGLWAHRVASMLHKDTDWKPPAQYFAKGNYFRLSGTKAPFQRLVYPVPEVGGLGVHATIDWQGSSTKFGPDVQWIDYRLTDPDEIDYNIVDSKRAASFYDEIRKYWPSLPDNSLHPDYTGVRPKLSHPDLEETLFSDFRISDQTEHGIPGLFHLFGVESPGLTASLGIAEYISTILRG